MSNGSLAFYPNYKADQAERKRLQYNCDTLRVSHLNSEQKFLNYPVFDTAYLAGMNHAISIISQLCLNGMRLEQADIESASRTIVSTGTNQAAISQSVGALDAYQTILDFIKPQARK